jgi:hypothetical protein
LAPGDASSDLFSVADIGFRDAHTGLGVADVAFGVAEVGFQGVAACAFCDAPPGDVVVTPDAHLGDAHLGVADAAFGVADAAFTVACSFCDAGNPREG